MKTLNEYLAMPYRMEIVEDREEGGFVVSFPELPGCITCGETLETAVANAQDAKKAWLEAALADGVVIQEPDSLENTPVNSSCGCRAACTAHWQSTPSRRASA